MSNHAVVAKLFQDVIDDVVKNMKQEFENEGVDDQVLQELQNLWEIKLQEVSIKDEDEEGGEEAYEPIEPSNNQLTYPDPFQQQGGSQGLPYPHRGDDVPQYDGATGTMSPGKPSINNKSDLYILSKLEDKPRPNVGEKRRKSKRVRKGTDILQVDGQDDDDDDEELDGDTGAQNDEDGLGLDDDDDGDEDLGADLDSSGDSEPETEDLLLCQFEKVTRTKNKWKTTLKDGVMRISGRDYVFHKGLGEFEW